MALRSADRRVRAAAGDGASRGPDADERSDRRARLRSRHDRAAARHLDGLHRRRPGRDDRRARGGGGALRLRVVGAAAARAARGWRRTGCCARAPSGAIATPTEVRAAQRDADYAYRLAVDPAPAKELRLFGLAGWTIDRFVERRTRLHALQYEATRLREKPVLWSLLLVLGANVVVFWSLASAAADGRISLAELVVFAQAARRHVADRVRRPQLGARRRRGAGGGGAAARERDGAGRRAARPGGAMPRATAGARDPLSRRRRSRIPAGAPVLEHFDLTIPAGSSLAIVGQNGAGKTTLAKLLCRLYDPQSGAIEVDGVDLRELDVASWRRARHRGLPGLHPLRAAAARQRRAGGRAGRGRARGARVGRRRQPRRARHDPRARLRRRHRSLRRPVAARRAGARARARCSSAPGVVLLDEPTAQLDVRGEAEIFERILAATRHCTTILISHRFSTVRHADRICVLEHGRVVELGTHDELMALRRPLPDDVRSAGAAVQRGRGRGGDDV